jgi:flagellar motor switch protein FliM
MVVMELIIGHTSGMMNICYPVISLEPLLPKLANRDIMLSETSSRKSRNRELRALLGGAKVEVEAVLGTTELDLKTVLDIAAGDIIRLDQAANDMSMLTVNGKPKFAAEFGVQRFRKTVKVREIIRTEHDDVKDMLQSLEDERQRRLALILKSGIIGNFDIYKWLANEVFYEEKNKDLSGNDFIISYTYK